MALLGLAKVKDREVLPFSGMLVAPKALTTVGGIGPGVTVRDAVLLGAPGPLSFALIAPVVLFKVPVALGTTSTDTKH